MAEENPFTIPIDAFGDRPNRFDPKEPLVDPNISKPTPKNHTRDHTPENASENASGDLVMQFVVQNFEKISAMYSTFLSKRKEVNPTSIIENDDHPILEPCQSDSGGQPEEAIQQTPRDATLAETKKNIRDLVASPFTARIRDYDMPDGLKVPTNLNTYDGTSDPDDHLTIFMGTMDVHKLPEPAWCRFFHINLCGAARFWDYLSRFGKKTLHTTDRSDGMMTGAFISELRLGWLFKDLIARPPKSMEDLFTQAHNFIKVDEANMENRLRNSRCGDNRRGQSYRDTSRRPRDRHITRLNRRLSEYSNIHIPTFKPLLKSLAEIYVTSKGRNSRLCHLARGVKAQNITPSSTTKKWKDQAEWKQRITETNIAFSNDDPIPEHYHGDNPLIIKANIRGCMIHRIYVDGGSSTEIMYEHCFQQLSNEARASIRALTSPNEAGVIASTVHLLIKFPIQSGVAIVRGDMLRKIECVQISHKRVRESDAEAISETQEGHAEKVNVVINASYQDQPVAIGGNLSPQSKEELR
ncbi:hypothetical protein Tco_0383220 [Tanacetum coccineum]